MKENPRDAAGRFLLAYHYLVIDERDAAVRHLREIVKLHTKDKLSATLLQTLEKLSRAQMPADKLAPGR